MFEGHLVNLISFPFHVSFTTDLWGDVMLSSECVPSCHLSQALGQPHLRSVTPSGYSTSWSNELVEQIKKLHHEMFTMDKSGHTWKWHLIYNLCESPQIFK